MTRCTRWPTASARATCPIVRTSRSSNERRGRTRSAARAAGTDGDHSCAPGLDSARALQPREERARGADVHASLDRDRLTDAAVCFWPGVQLVLSLYAVSELALRLAVD